MYPGSGALPHAALLSCYFGAFSLYLYHQRDIRHRPYLISNFAGGGIPPPPAPPLDPPLRSSPFLLCLGLLWYKNRCHGIVYPPIISSGGSRNKAMGGGGGGGGGGVGGAFILEGRHILERAPPPPLRGGGRY